MDELSLQDLPPISAVPWSEFLECPEIMYSLFESTMIPGCVKYHSDVVYDLSKTVFSHSFSELIVRNVEELHRVTNDLLTMPLLFRIKVEHSKTDHGIVKVTHKWRDEFAVLVNTRHHGIREMLTHKLTEAMQMMQENKKFCLKIDFGPSIKQWYSGIVDAQVGCFDGRFSDDSGGTTVWVTNHSSPIEQCFSPILIIFCFPFWFLCCGPCYVTNRKIKCIDTKVEFSDLGVTMLTGTRYVVRTMPLQ